jgi:hypothetical protein
VVEARLTALIILFYNKEQNAVPHQAIALSHHELNNYNYSLFFPNEIYFKIILGNIVFHGFKTIFKLSLVFERNIP